MVVGVTGTSGSGKSMVSKLLKNKLNCYLIDADVVAKRISEKGNRYYDEIVKAFGEDILDEQKEIFRGKLAEIVYNDNSKREILNDITNIYVVDEIKQEISMLLKNGIVISEECRCEIPKDCYYKQCQGSLAVIIDVPRLIESGLGEMCNVIIGVIADKEIKINRICNRDNISKEYAEARLRIQPKDKFYIDNTNYLIENNDDNLEEDIDLMVDILNKVYKIQERRNYDFV